MFSIGVWDVRQIECSIFINRPLLQDDGNVYTTHNTTCYQLTESDRITFLMVTFYGSFLGDQNVGSVLGRTGYGVGDKPTPNGIKEYTKQLYFIAWEVIIIANGHGTSPYCFDFTVLLTFFLT